MSILPALKTAARSLGGLHSAGHASAVTCRRHGAGAQKQNSSRDSTRHRFGWPRFLDLLTLPSRRPSAAHRQSFRRDGQSSHGGFNRLQGVLSRLDPGPDPVDLRWDLMGTLPGAPSLLPRPAGPASRGDAGHQLVGGLASHCWREELPLWCRRRGPSVGMLWPPLVRV